MLRSLFYLVSTRLLSWALFLLSFKPVLSSVFPAILSEILLVPFLFPCKVNSVFILFFPHITLKTLLRFLLQSWSLNTVCISESQCSSELPALLVKQWRFLETLYQNFRMCDVGMYRYKDPTGYSDVSAFGGAQLLGCPWLPRRCFQTVLLCWAPNKCVQLVLAISLWACCRNLKFPMFKPGSLFSSPELVFYKPLSQFMALSFPS